MAIEPELSRASRTIGFSVYRDVLFSNGESNKNEIRVTETPRNIASIRIVETLKSLLLLRK
jgi:hypothetical protein